MFLKPSTLILAYCERKKTDKFVISHKFYTHKMSTINLMWQIVSYNLLLTDKAYFSLHNIPIIILTMCTFFFKLFVDLLLYFINYYGSLLSNVKILHSDNNLPCRIVPQKLVLHIYGTR